MTQILIPPGQFPDPLPAGLVEGMEAAGISLTRSPDGLHVSNDAAARAFIAAYAGSAAELAYHRARKQAALDDFFDAHFDLAAFIRGGVTTPVTAAQVGTFLAAITSNYRSLRAQIAAAVNVAAVAAIDVTKAWPVNA